MDDQPQTPNQNQQPGVIQPQWQYQSGQLEQQGGFDQTLIQQPVEPSEPSAAVDTDQAVRWTASEFISHEKSGSWYILLGVTAVILSAVIYFFTKEIFSVVVVIVLAAALGVFGALKPRTLDYAIYPDGLQVGEKHFTFDMFRSFAVIEDAPVPSIQFLPQKRFMVPITIYFAPNDADTIIETLGEFLPMEQKKRDFVDKLSSRIRF